MHKRVWGPRLGTLMAAAIVMLTGSLHAADTFTNADRARALVDRFHADLLETMRNGDQLGFDGRVNQLAPAVTEAFNLPFMTRIAVGFQWRQLTPEERHAVMDSFSAFTVASYAHNFASYAGERFDLVDVVAGRDGRWIVKTQLIPSNSEPVDLNYLTQTFDGDWRIFDVLLSGTISELANRRSEFAGVLRRDGVEGLIALLDEKVADFRDEE